jgi:type IV pilus assembly protein PilV
MRPISLRQSQSGSILIESLVAILLFSLGMLAFVGQQAAAIKYVSDSRYRTEAALWADNLLGQMAAAPQSTLFTQYASGGPAFTAWRNQVIAAGSGIPGATAANVTIALTDADPLVGGAATALTRYLGVTITINWSVRGNEQVYGAGDLLGGTYTTNTTLYLGAI